MNAGLNNEPTPSQFVVVVVSVLLLAHGTLSCETDSWPVARLCFNNTITFTNTSYAVARGLGSKARDCKCVLTTDGSKHRLRISLQSNQATCGTSSVQMKTENSRFSTKFQCVQSSPRTLSVQKGSDLHVNYERRTDDDICIKYTSLSGLGPVKISCDGDDLSTAIDDTTTQSATTRQTTTVAVTSNKHLSTSILSTSSTKKTSTEFPTKTQSEIVSKTSRAASTVVSVAIETTFVNNTEVKETSTFFTDEINMTSSNVTDELTSTEITSVSVTKETTAKENSESSDRKLTDGEIAAIVCGSVAFILFVVLLVIALKRKRRQQTQKKLAGSPGHTNGGFVESFHDNKSTENTTIGDVTEIEAYPKAFESSETHGNDKIENLKLKEITEDNESNLYPKLKQKENEVDTLY